MRTIVFVVNPVHMNVFLQSNNLNKLDSTDWAVVGSLVIDVDLDVAGEGRVVQEPLATMTTRVRLSLVISVNSHVFLKQYHKTFNDMLQSFFGKKS